MELPTTRNEGDWTVKFRHVPFALVVSALLAVPIATIANAEKSLRPVAAAVGTWCNTNGTFVFSGGRYTYSRRGVVKVRGTYQVNGNRMFVRNSATGRTATWTFYRNPSGVRFYRHHSGSLIRVSRKCG